MNTATATAPSLQYFSDKAIRLFWRKVSKSDGCWIWTGATNNKGYGVIRDSGKTCLAHRISYRINIGPIHDGLCVLHRCDVRLCVNPEHFFLGTKFDNNVDMRLKGRDSRGEKHSLICRGENHSRLKLNNQKVMEIRWLYHNTSTTHLAIAIVYGVSGGTVASILSGKSWSFVKGEIPPSNP